MEKLLSQSVASKKDLKGLGNILDFMYRQNFSHPIIQNACNELGISNEQLIPRSFHEIQDKNANAEINLVRFEHFEARRKVRLNVVAEFLLEKKIFLGDKGKNGSKKALTPSPLKNNPDNALSASFSYETSTERKVLNIKKRVIQRMTVQENLKKIKQEEEESRKAIEEKTKAKEKREKNIVKNVKNFEIRDKRIKERLRKKKIDLETHEKEALKSVYHSDPVSKSYYIYTPTNNYLEVTFT